MTAIDKALAAASETAQKAEQALRESEERFRLLVDGVRDYAIYLIDINGAIVSWNPGAQRMFGYLADDIVGRPFAILLPNDDVAEGLPNHELAMATREGRFEIEGWRIRKDGSRFWTHILLSALYDGQGHVIGFANVSRDLTEKKRLEESLAQTARELGNIKQAVDVSTIVAITDKQGRITYVNDAFCRISKYSPQELIGRTHAVINSNYHPKSFFQQMWATIGQGHIWKGEVKNQAKDGSYYWVDTTIYPLLGGDGKPEEYIAIRYDITELKQISEQLQANSHRQKLISWLGDKALEGMSAEQLMSQAVQLVAGALQADYVTILELMPDQSRFSINTVYGFDPQLLGLTMSSSGLESQAGYTLLIQEPVTVEDFCSEIRFKSPMVALGTDITSGLSVLLHGKNRQEPFGVLLVHNRKKRRFTTDSVNFVQSVANVLANAIERQHAEERLKRFNQELEQRVTERTEQLEQSNKQKSRILAMVSHDFKTPLAAISRFTELLETDEDLTEKQAKILNFIAEGTRQLRVMVTDILDRARIEAGQVTVLAEPIPIREFIQATLPPLCALADERDVTIVTDFAPEMSDVHADPVLLRQILVNLLSNAIKYNKRGGRVFIKLWTDPALGMHIIEVRDTGIGISEADLAGLFTDFYRVGPGMDGIEGTGLGLASTRKLVELHSGSIHVHSMEGDGSAFEVRLPI